MTHDQALLVSWAMHNHGGSFVKALAECFIYADLDNLSRLEKAFPEYIERYTKIANEDLDKGYGDTK